METGFLNRVQATLLALATAALFVLAVFNLLQERQSQQPDDGVWWSEASGGLQAQKVEANKPGQRAGIRAGDLLTAVDDEPADTEFLAGIKHSPAGDASSDSNELTQSVKHHTPEGRVPVGRVSDLERALYSTGSYGQVLYYITRDGIPLRRRSKLFPSPLIEVWRLGCASSGSST